MPLLLAYAIALLAAVLVSERASRTILSTAVVFLAAGMAFNLLRGPADAEVVRGLADLALVAVLFTDGMHVCLPELRDAWRLPGRALLLGFPLTLAGNALAAHGLAGTPWVEAFLVGAALAPTDPVFASAIVGREEVPGRLRHLLNVESGLNDGLPLPFVVALLAAASREALPAARIAGELGAGIALGAVVPLVAVRLERSPAFGSSEAYRPIGVLSVGLLVYAIARTSHVNEFLAAFAAGATLATTAPRARGVFAPVAEVLTELLKLAAVLTFGALISPGFLREVSPGGWAFAFATLFLVRPAALGLALVGSALDWRERLVAAWFGPKGFASVVYGLFIAGAAIPGGDGLFRLVAVTTALSIVLHSSTDVPVARWFRGREAAPSAAR